MNIDESYYCSKCMRRILSESKCPYCGYDPETDVNESPALETGTLLSARYQLGSIIGKGGFGIVYAAWDEILNIPVAVKEYFPRDLALRNTEFSDEIQISPNNRNPFFDGLRHFLQEARVLAMLQNMPGAVSVRDWFEENGTAYIVMEYIWGITLEDYSREHPLFPKELFSMLYEPVNALVALHKNGILHRDITPSNLLVQEDGSVKLIDFGSAARMYRDQTLLITTQHFAPIEQYQSEGSRLGPWTDIYSLCATIYFLLTRKSPPESLSRIANDNLEPIERMVHLKTFQKKAITRGLAVEPEKRTQSMEEFRSVLYQLPMPEEVLQRKKLFRRMYSLCAAFFLLFTLLFFNFLTGFPLGDGLFYSLRGDGWHIVGGTAESESLSIRDAVLGLPVSLIEEEMFSYNQTLKEVTIPGSVKSIRQMAFYHCPNLQSVTIETGVTSIKEHAFSECESLRSVYLPETLADAAESAFSNTSPFLTAWGEKDGTAQTAADRMGLNFCVRSEYEIQDLSATEAALVSYCGNASHLVLPSYIDGKAVTEIPYAKEGEDFSIPASVRELSLPEHLQEYPMQGLHNSGEDFTCVWEDMSPLTVTFNPHLKNIGADAFSNLNLRDVTLPEGLTTICDRAFSGCSLSSIVIPDTVSSIGSAAFAFTSLESVTLPSALEECSNALFTGCTNLKEAVLPKSLSSISDSMFRNCSSLVTLKLPQNIQYIGKNAFQNCTSLEYLALPQGTTEIQSQAFSECYSLKYIDIPNSVTQIDETAFEHCSSQLVIGGTSESEAERFAHRMGIQFENKDTWDAQVFFPEPGVVSVTADSSTDLVLPVYDSVHGTLVHTVTSQGLPAGLHKVRLPLFAEVVEEDAFSAYFLDEAEKYSLKTVTVPNSLKVIGQNAFSSCRGLENFYFPDGLERIGDGAFFGCHSLESIWLPDSLYYLGDSAFEGCSNLKDARLPEDLPYLGRLAFLLTQTGLDTQLP